MRYKAEYIWIDGTRPTAKLRSKTKILADGAEPPIWGFDGSSTNQAEGHASDRVLKPVASFPDPIRGGDDVLVMCEVLNIDDDTARVQHPRRAARGRRASSPSQEPMFGIEQEYTFFQGSRPLGFPDGGFPAPQGGYYCGVGADEIFGRAGRREAPGELPRRRARHLRHQRRGHARPVGVPGRPARPAGGRRPAVGGALAALPHRRGLRRLRDARPQAGQGRLERRRRAHQLLHQGDARGLRRGHRGRRVAGRATTSRWTTSRTTAIGVDDSPHRLCTRPPRGTSTATASPTAAPRCASRGRSRRTKKGYIEDRRPNANVDPYVVTRLIVDTCCTALEKADLA